MLISPVTLVVNKHEYDWKKVKCFILSNFFHILFFVHIVSGKGNEEEEST